MPSRISVVKNLNCHECPESVWFGFKDEIYFLWSSRLKLKLMADVGILKWLIYKYIFCVCPCPSLGVLQCVCVGV